MGLADIEESFEAVNYFRDQVNHRLNPITLPRERFQLFETDSRLTHEIYHTKSNRKHVSESELNQAIAYLKMNKKLLGKTCPPEVMLLLKELISYRSFIERFGDGENYSVENDDSIAVNSS